MVKKDVPHHIVNKKPLEFEGFSYRQRLEINLLQRLQFQKLIFFPPKDDYHPK
jgi:hypothetical protein